MPPEGNKNTDLFIFFEEGGGNREGERRREEGGRRGERIQKPEEGDEGVKECCRILANGGCLNGEEGDVIFFRLPRLRLLHCRFKTKAVWV